MKGQLFSEGRGTDKPFQIFGHPLLPATLYSFTPVPKDGAKDPKLKNQVCYGWNVSGTPDDVLKSIDGHLQLHYLLEAYKLFPDKEHFFLKPQKENSRPQDYSFNRLAGNDQLMQQIKQGWSETRIRKSWEPALSEFKKIRKKYLMYD